MGGYLGKAKQDVTSVRQMHFLTFTVLLVWSFIWLCNRCLWISSDLFSVFLALSRGLWNEALKSSKIKIVTK